MCNYENVKQYRLRNPWARPREFARRRCLDKKHRAYDTYGGRGIKFSLTMKEAKILFARAWAWRFKKPSLDRWDPDGHYTYSNCRFIELTENVARRRPNGSLKKEQPVASGDWEE